MIHTIVTRIGPLGVTVIERNGRWRATLCGGHPSLGPVASAIDRSADDAVANLAAAVDAALTPASMLGGRPALPAVPADG
jgi:hypothetical protein